MKKLLFILTVLTAVAFANDDSMSKPNHPGSERDTIKPNYPTKRFDNIKVNKPLAQESSIKPNHPMI